MPKRETFLEIQRPTSKVFVLKTYDRQFAREVFDQIDETARGQLVNTLQIEQNYDLDSAPSADEIWDELADQSREDSNRFSFFIVQKNGPGTVENLYVSPDWPSAEHFATGLD